jgi:hypothetical protein
MSYQDWICLANRDVAKILEGDSTYKISADNQEYELGMPYLTGTQICDIASQFGFKLSVNNSSRWEIFKNLIDFCVQKGVVDKLLSALFRRERFESINNLPVNKNEQDRIFDSLCQIVLEDINKHIVFSGKKLEIANKQFFLFPLDDNLIVPENDIHTSDYLRAFPGRIKLDLNNEAYDSVVTKSRTYIEETCIFILEQKGLSHSGSGEIEKLYEECKESLNMKRSSEWNNLVSDLVNGLNKIVKSIGSMRNKNSDSHGVGSKRISIKRREASLIANSSITLCDYLLSVFESQK